MIQWLSQHLPTLELDDDHYSYLLSRGARESSFEAMGVRTWQAPSTPAPCASFRKRYGDCGEKINGCLVFPVYSPVGGVIGLEIRRIPRPGRKRWISDYRVMPRSRWEPYFVGMGRSVDKLWEGRPRVWLVEGIFDLFALEWVVPSHEVILATVTAHVGAMQAAFLQRFTDHVCMVYDEDPQGYAGYHKAQRDLRRLGLTVNQIRYVAGTDPGDIWISQGAEGLRRAFGDVI